MSYQIDRTTWRSPNHSARTQTPNTIVVHSCEGRLPNPRESSLPWLCNPKTGVSTHYYICRNTVIYQLVDDMRAAWHAGVSLDAYSNPFSLGVELEHRRGQDWPSAQKDALAWLLRALSARWRFPIDRIETHGQIAIKGPYKRKTDPSDWPHADFVAWRAQLAATDRYRVRGIPVYQASDRTGPLWGWLKQDQVIEIDDMGNGHVATVDGQPAPIGFIRFDPDTLEAL